MNSDSITSAIDTAMDLIEDGEDTAGVCTECLEVVYGVEPDARQYECPSCGCNTVYGAEQILIEFA